MKNHLAMQAVALSLACFIAPAMAQEDAAEEILGGIPGLACEAILCLSSSLQPSPCSPSLAHYFAIEIFDKYGLDWGATVAARNAFLSMCPVVSEPGMSSRIDAISKGAGKCDPEYLNSAYAGTSYKWRIRGYRNNWNGEASYEPIYDVIEIPTVTLNTLPSYCVTYNDHEWTYELSVKYVGVPAHGGKWVKAEDYDQAQATWNAAHGESWSSGWNFSYHDPREEKQGF